MYEIWLPIIYEDIKLNLYEISNYGRIRNINTSKILKQQTSSNNGYYHYTGYMTISNKQKNVSTHRIVATMFVPNPENKPEVNHRDGYKNQNDIKCHNFSWNLEWVLPKENIQHAKQFGLRNYIGENNPKSLITDQQVIEVCELLVKYNGNIHITYDSLTDNSVITKQVIKQIKNKETWVHISNKYFSDIYCIRRK